MIKQLLEAMGFRRRSRGSLTSSTRFPVECDEDDRRILQDVIESGLSMTSSERLFTTLMACKHVCEAGLAGDFVECGVWRGGNSVLAADVFRRNGGGRLTWLFDTYKGMTEPTEADVKYDGTSARGTFERKQRSDRNDWCYASIEDVQANFKERGLDANARFVIGDVLATLERPENLARQISVLRLDTDWYESTRKELEVLYPRLAPGGVLIIDDYGYWGGARKAVDEYFRTVPRPFLQYTDETGRVGIKLK